MESMVVAPSRRGRKRMRKDALSTLSGPIAKRQGVATRGKMVLVGRYVKKGFDGSGIYLGKVVFFEDGLYRVDYEDGDCEDLDSAEVKSYLVEDADLDADWMAKKCKLDELISKKNVKHAKCNIKGNVKHAEGNSNDAKRVDKSILTEISNGGARERDVVESNDDGDLSSDSFDHDLDKDLNSAVNVPIVPPPQLPPSTGNIGVPDKYVLYLLSVYVFLRSFSIQLFLSPFGLDDFVGSLNCPLPNTLLDAIHVSLMRLLKRHLEMLVSEGSELAMKCMRLTDWSLLDTLTWPIVLVQYLMSMRRITGPQWTGFYVDALEKNYYSLPTGWKLMILQILCDDVLESVELRSEIDIREETEVGIDPDVVGASESETGPRRVHPRYSKTSACKNEETVGIMSATHETKLSYGEDANISDDGNIDECRLCGMDGTLLCCDGCPLSYHSRCIGVNKLSIPEGTWYCPECAISRTGMAIAGGTSLTGAQVFGIDRYGHTFLGSCNHLLVLEISIKSEPCFRYYHQKDIPKVLQALLSSAEHIILYFDICKSILRYWDIPRDVITPLVAKVEMDEQSAEVRDDSQFPRPIDMLGDESHMLAILEDKKLKGCITENGGGNVVASCVENSIKDSLRRKSSLITRTYGSYNGLLDMFFDSKEDIKGVIGAGNKKSSGNCAYMGLHFKPQAYINTYSQGDFSASAAASLAVLSSEEKEVSEAHALDKRRKAALADNLLQIKAFSSVATRFFWPTHDKKLVDVPRERCHWCFQCKSPASSRRGCLLNAAALNATKSSIKIVAGLPAIKNGEGCLRAIATCIILMEESLCGLVVGAFQSAAYRHQWRKQVEQATTHNTIKSLLLELERNICAIALSTDWFKLVESWLIESPVTQTTTTATGSTQKRGGRRGRKPLAVSEPESDDQTDSSIAFTWWRGGIFSKRILHKGVLPYSVIKKAARQGGCRSIPGIVYGEGIGIPKRSRQCFWRAAVEMSKNYSELALQVRRLDLYVRWSDLIRPEQTLPDGKGQEEALAFRNAHVTDRKNVEDKIIYGVVFGIQKHLPSRIMKNIIEVEQLQNGKKKYWFYDTRIPLYLIKEYEEKVDQKDLPFPEKTANMLSNLQRKQLRACRKEDIFSYMTCKRDNLVKCGCASCQLDVFLGNAFKCNVCEGFCHERCTIGSTTHKDGEVEHIMTCKQCLTKSLPPSEEKSPTSPVLCQGKAIQNAVTTRGGFKQTNFHNPVTPVGHENRSLETKTGVPDSGSGSKSKIASWGLIFKKNKDGKTQAEKEKEDEDALKFRMGHILRKSNTGRNSEGPNCHLCNQPYSPEVAYILCDTCKNWYHTESLELEESKFPDVVGFKCCKCRRTRSPVCPYLDPSKKKTTEVKRLRSRREKGSNPESDSHSSICDQPTEIENTPLLSPPTEVVPCISGDDTLLYSLPMAEQFPEPSFEIDSQITSCSKTGPQKLPVRRPADNEKNTDSSADQAYDYSLPPCVEWDVSGNDLTFSYEDPQLEGMPFEEQTYFTYNELLAPEDGAQGEEAPQDGGDMSAEDFDYACEDFGDGFPEDFVMDDVLFCERCSLAEPPPDLYCHNCGLCIHRGCSPWDEEYPLQGQWACGKCRG